jgi:hypothetical protein
MAPVPPGYATECKYTIKYYHTSIQISFLILINVHETHRIIIGIDYINLIIKIDRVIDLLNIYYD